MIAIACDSMQLQTRNGNHCIKQEEMLHQFSILFFYIAVKILDDRKYKIKKQTLSIALQLQKYKQLLLHQKHMQKQGEMLHKFSILLFLRCSENNRRPKIQN